jgi:hypothetical protein
MSRTTKAGAALRTTLKQRGGVTGKGFVPGRSGNPGGRPRGERAYLATIYGEDGRKVYERLELLRHDRQTSRKLRAEIDMFILERLFGRAQQHHELTAGVGPIVFQVVTNVPRGRHDTD